MELEGKVIVVGSVNQLRNDFTKRDIVIETDEKYPQKVKVEFIKDKCSLVDGVNVGDDVKVSINIRGNEYQGKYYTNIQGWRLEKTSAASPPQKEGVAPNAEFLSAVNEEEEDDLPF